MNVRNALRRTVSELPPPFWFLWIGTIVNRLGGFVTPFLSLYLTGSRGLNMADVGLVVSMYGVGQFAASFVSGAVSDRFGRRPVLLLSFLGSPVVVLALGLFRSFFAILPCTFLVGMIGNLYRPAMSAAVSDLVPPNRRVRAFGYIYWAINLGAAIAPVLAGIMARSDYFLLFAGDALTTLAFGMIIVFRVPETRSGAATVNGAATLQESGDAQPTAATGDPAARAGSSLRAPSRRRARGSARGVAVDPVILLFSLLSLITGAVYAQNYSTLPVAMRAHGLDASLYGVAIALNGLLIVIFGVPSARLAERLPRFPIMALAALLLGIGFGLTGRATTFAGYALTILLWTMGEIASAAVAPAIVADLAPPGLVGTYQGIYSSSWGLSWFVGPFLGGLVYNNLGPGVLWTGCFVFCAVAAAGQLLLGRRSHRA